MFNHIDIVVLLRIYTHSTFAASKTFPVKIPGEVMECSETPDWNIPQVIRFIGNKWHHECSKLFSV